VTAGYFVAAGWQRDYALRRLHRWRPVPEGSRIDVEVVTLACERDALELMRMASSFVRHAGHPAELVVVDDGSLSRATADAVRRVSRSVRVTSLPEFATALPEHPLSERLVAGAFPHAKKLALLAQGLGERPRLYADTDIEFFPAAARLRAYVEDPDPRPRYNLHADDAGALYDPRMTEGLELAPGVNAGFCLFRGPVDWRPAFDRLAPVADDATPLSEQTAVAIAMAGAGGVPLPEDQFVLAWDDLRVPWDPYARGGAVLRHYASPARRWKLWLRGGPAGMRTLPLAAIEALVRGRGPGGAG